MKTIQQIVNEHLAARAALAGNPEAMIAEAHKAEARMVQRFESDPSLAHFVENYADALVNILKIIPPEVHQAVVRNVIAQVVAEWEDVNREYEKQLLKPTS